MQTDNTTQLKKILSNFNVKELNKMQSTSLQAIQNNQNIILHSATGSGKTLAFLLPLVNLLSKTIKGTQALIIVPSRELAIQIDEVFRKMQTGFKVTLCYGGHKREIEETNLIQTPALIIGTPGRLADHLRRNNFKTNEIKTIILDEFDKSLELGFAQEMEFIFGQLKNINKCVLVSATELLTTPQFLDFDKFLCLNFLQTDTENFSSLEVKTVLSANKDKSNTLFKVLCFLGNRSTIIFCNHRESVERTSAILAQKGIINVFYHGGMEQQDRDVALCKFKNKTSNILITTDLAARGLDIPNIRNIIHYHLPTSEEIFIHRNGRTARMDASGTIYVIYSNDEKIPEYITRLATEQLLAADYPLPEKPKWTTLFIAAGKKNKVNKIDIFGFLGQKGKLKKEDIGLIEVKDFFSFVAIKKIKVNEMLNLIKSEKIKNKKVKITVAK